MSKAIDDIAAERRRQVETEGWSPEHDDQYSEAQLARAALQYVAVSATSVILGHKEWAGGALIERETALRWPWDEEWWKPGTPRRMLVKAAALIAAEIDRLDRVAARVEGEGHG